MTFFNKKEDVLKIELTPHGRKLLSMGKLKPYCYGFLDDDILYDLSSTGVSETNSQTKNRILSETPYLKPQTNYKAIDSNKSDSDNKTEQAIYLQQKIGSNKTSENRASGWQVTTLLGEMESSQNSLTGTLEPTQIIPQLEYEINYTMSVGNISDVELGNQGLLFSRDIPSSIKPDGTFVDVVSEQTLINIFERNSFSHKESYEIEVYLYNEDEQGLNRKLKFIQQDTQIQNNMLVEEDTLSSSEEATTEHVEYYMDILTDNEIPEEDICDGLRRLKSKDIFLDIEVECPDRDDVDINIYGTRITDLEDC